MKKSVLLFLIVAMLCTLMLSACNAKKEDSDVMNAESSIGTNQENEVADTDKSETKESLIGTSQENEVADTDKSETKESLIGTNQENEVADTNKSETKESASEQTVHKHSYGTWKTVTKATCEKEGVRERACSCGEKETSAISKIEHNYKNNVCTMCQKTNSAAFVPDYSSGQANVVGRESGFTKITAQADWLYFAAGSRQIAKVKKNSTDAVSVYSVASGNVFHINVVGDWLYFFVKGSQVSSSYIAKVRTDGSGFTKILSSVNVGEMLVVKDKIFFTTITSPYNDWAKDFAPLYWVPVAGGMTQQVHDGYVSSLAADSTYLYFRQETEERQVLVYRIKHDTANKKILLTDTDLNYFVLKDSKLYFLKLDGDSEGRPIMSMSVNGGSVTTLGQMPFYSGWLAVFGDKIYYYGNPYPDGKFVKEKGIIEYDMKTKQYKTVKQTTDSPECFSASDLLIMENYTGQTFVSLSVYNPQTNAWKEVKVK